MEHIWWVQVSRGRGRGAHGTSKPKVGDGEIMPAETHPRTLPLSFAITIGSSLSILFYNWLYRIKVNLNQNFVSSCGN